MKGLGIPLFILLVLAGGVWWLSQQRQAVKVDHQMRPIQAQPAQAPLPQPSIETKGTPVPGGTFHSLDRLNALAATVGCPILEPGDPAVKVFEVATCLGERAVAAKK